MKQFKRYRKSLVSSLLVMTVLPVPFAEACTSVIVGKNATVDGSTMIARNEDMSAAWPKYFVVRPGGQNEETQYVSKGNGFTVELPQERFKTTATPEGDESEGSFDEAGINSEGVAMSGTESLSANDDVLNIDPLVEDGIAEDSLNAVVLPYIKSAREGVERLGKIVEEKGAAEGNGVIFSDKDEVWYMEIATGHQWVAQRIPDDSYAVIANQIVIEEVNLEDKENFMASKDILKVAQEANRYKEGDTFSFEKAYGTDTEEDQVYNYPRVWYGQKLLTPSVEQDLESYDFPFVMKPDEKMDIEDIEKVLSSHFEGTDYDYRTNQESTLRPASVPQTMESHILQIRQDLPNDIAGVHWLNMGQPESSVYVPFYSGITETPEAYRMGDTNFSSGGAYWTFRLAGALMDQNYDLLKEDFIVPAKDEARKMMAEDLKASDEKASSIEDPQERAKYLTESSAERAQKMMDKWKELTDQMMVELLKNTPVYHNPDL